MNNPSRFGPFCATFIKPAPPLIFVKNKPRIKLLSDSIIGALYLRGINLLYNVPAEARTAQGNGVYCSSGSKAAASAFTSYNLNYVPRVQLLMIDNSVQGANVQGANVQLPNFNSLNLERGEIQSRALYRKPSLEMSSPGEGLLNREGIPCLATGLAGFDFVSWRLLKSP